MKIKLLLSLGIFVTTVAVHSVVLVPSGFAADKSGIKPSIAAGKTFQSFQVAQKSKLLLSSASRKLLKQRNDLVKNIADHEAKLKNVKAKLKIRGRMNLKSLLIQQKQLTQQIKDWKAELEKVRLALKNQGISPQAGSGKATSPTVSSQQTSPLVPGKPSRLSPPTTPILPKGTAKGPAVSIQQTPPRVPGRPSSSSPPSSTPVLPLAPNTLQQTQSQEDGSGPINFTSIPLVGTGLRFNRIEKSVSLWGVGRR